MLKHFLKDEKASTETKKVYHIKSDTSSIIIPYASIISPFNTKNIINKDDFTVTIESDKISFTNNYFSYGKECKDIATFTNINKVESLEDRFKDKVFNVSASVPLASFLSPNEQTKADSFNLTSDVLNYAYLVGGAYNSFSYDFDTFKDEKALIVKYPYANSSELAKLLITNLAKYGYKNYDDYKDKLFTNGTVYYVDVTGTNKRLVYECILATMSGISTSALWITMRCENK